MFSVFSWKTNQKYTARCKFHDCHLFHVHSIRKEQKPYFFLCRTFNIYGNRYDVHNKQVEIASQSDIILYKTQKLEFAIFISSPIYLYLTECTIMASMSRTFSTPFNLLKTCSFYTRPRISKIQLDCNI